MLGASAIERTPDGPRYWFDAPDEPRLAVSVVGVSLAWAPGGPASAVVEGHVLRLARPPEGARALELTAGSSKRTLRFMFRASPKAITDRFAAAAAADLVAARTALAALPASEWPWGCVGVARTVAPEQKPEAYVACADGALERGFVTEAISRRIAALFWARRLRQFSRARALIEQVERALKDFPDARLASQFHYQQGVFLAETGELRGAEAVLQRATREAVEATQPDEATLYRAYVAVVQSEAGRHLEALATAAEVEAVEAPSLSAGDRLAVRTNVSWVKLRALLHRVPVPESFAAALRVELEHLSAEALADGQTLEASNTLSNLAWLEFSEGHLERAREVLTRARSNAGEVPTLESVFLDWLDGRLALASGDAAGAARAFESMLRVAALTAERVPDSRWRAQLGLAEARLLQGRGAEAERALAEARRELSSQARGFDDPTQRVLFLEDRRGAIADAVEAFFRAGRCALAFRLAEDGQTWLARSFEVDRRVRLAQLTPEARAQFEVDEGRWATEREALLAEAAPALASVAEVQQWRERRTTSLESLRARAVALAERLEALAPTQPRASFGPNALQRDEALLELFETTGAVRAFFVRKTGEVQCAKSERELLTPTALKTVRHLFVVEGGARLSPLSLRAALTDASVSFLPSAAWVSPPAERPRGPALVVGDPRFDLPGARKEAREVAARVGGTLLEGDGATLEAVLAHWAGRSLLHFAVHGRLSPAAPWDARLDLASGQALDFELLLARRPAPGLVVLSGCETGTALEAPADGIGLAEGFLAGGAHQVLATTVEVRDDAARTFIERFYRLGGVDDAAGAFRRAVLEADAAGDESWRQWKLLGRRSRD